MNIHTIILIIFAFEINAKKIRYENYGVYGVHPKNEVQIKLLQNLMEKNNNFDFWNEPVTTSKKVLIMSDPKNQKDLLDFFKEHSLEAELTIPNVQILIDSENIKKYTRSNIKNMTWDAYYDMDSINIWLDDLVSSFPQASEIIGGVTIEGRQIKGIRISHGAGRRAIFLEGGIHSREWISPATVNYITYMLLTSNDQHIAEIATEFDWYIFPVTNPDGYIWSHESSRFWRKNRRRINEFSHGIDLNRNWNNNWLVEGASHLPASDSYAGLGPFSEPETRSFSDYIRSVAPQLDMYLSFHSFSQYLLLPFGNTTYPLDNYHDAINIGRRAMGALSVKYGTQYTTGNIAEVIYKATGGSVDWVKEVLKVPLVYCYELRDDGRYGFLLPAEQILPNNEEVMDSLVDLIYQAKRFGYMKG